MTRLRKEYLYRRSLQGKEREIYEKKRKIREALRGAFVKLFFSYLKSTKLREV
jgi:hypothetical protein